MAIVVRERKDCEGLGMSSGKTGNVAACSESTFWDLQTEERWEEKELTLKRRILSPALAGRDADGELNNQVCPLGDDSEQERLICSCDKTIEV